jgi:LacI family transcriptional regulator
MGGVERYFMRKNFVYFTACHYWKPKLVEEYSSLLVKRGAEGLLLLNTNADIDSIVPVVTVAGHREKEGVTNVVIDHAAAARMAIRHLYQLGHRKIAFMKGHWHVMDTDYRWKAMMETARAFGVQPTEDRIVQMRTSNWSPEVGYEPAKRLTEMTRDFTALVCFNDTAAIGAIRALHDAGMRVPQDVSVIGFDDIVPAQFHVPSLTTIRQPLARMGRLAASILLDRIANPENLYAPTIMVKPKLIVRESTAKAKGRRS